MAETDLKRFLAKLYDNYSRLQVWEANYVNSARIDLLSQIDDYKQAIDLTEQALGQEISSDELQAEVKSFNPLNRCGGLYTTRSPTQTLYRIKSVSWLA